jgi:hypothetical protein
MRLFLNWARKIERGGKMVQKLLTTFFVFLCSFVIFCSTGTKSLCNLGVIFIKGAENVPRNDVLAVKYLKKAVDGGDTTAALNLGKMCEVGRAGKSFFKILFCV